MDFPVTEPGVLPPDPVGQGALHGIPRQQTNPSRWQGEGWQTFVDELSGTGIEINQQRDACTLYVTDAGGMAHGLPGGTLIAKDASQIAAVMKAAQRHKVPVTVRGGGLTTEGESVAFGGLLLDLRGLDRVLEIDTENLTVRTQTGIFWHTLAGQLRRQGLDYHSAPLNMTSSVGGTLGVGGVDINSHRFGCSADQALALQVVTPTGEIVECSEEQNRELFERVILGYGQFGIITEATLKARPYTPLRMQYLYYGSLSTATEDLLLLNRNDASDYSGILTMMDRAITLLVAFDSEERQRKFEEQWQPKLRGHGEALFTLSTVLYYALRPWRLKEALFLYRRKKELFPDLQPPEHMEGEEMVDRTVVFSRAVWKHWGGRQMVIPDISTSEEKFLRAVEKGNAICKKYFPHYTLYCVGIRVQPEHKARYELSCIPPDAEGIAYGCEFEPMLEDGVYSRDYLQSFKNEIYDAGLELGGSYYRFGGMMKGYIRRMFGDELVDRHLEMKRQADPAFILNRDVIF